MLTAIFASSATADTYRFVRANPSGGSAGGDITLVDTAYNNESEVLRWTAVFQESTTGLLPAGFNLAINGTGQNPKGHDGELALFYFDASDINNPVLNVFAYNGLTSVRPQTSYRDGSRASGTQAPDPILTSLDASDVANNDIQLSVVDGVLASGERTRTFVFQLDATQIQQHVPLHAGNITTGEVWQGAQFESRLGYWFHSNSAITTNYNAAGYLEDVPGQLGYQTSGALSFSDTANLKPTNITPSCAGLPDISVDLGGTVSFSARGRNPDTSDPLEVNVTGTPAGAVITNSNVGSSGDVAIAGEITSNFMWTPPFSAEGQIFMVDFTFSNGIADVTCSAKITVNTNPAPTSVISSLGSLGALSCANETTTVSLDGSGSSDVNAGPNPVLGYRWTSNCPNAEFSDSNAPTTDITFDSTVDNKPTGCIVTLTVSDGQKGSTSNIDLAVTGCIEDCAGTINGSTEIDKCGVCGGLDADLDRCGVCRGDGESCLACVETNQSVVLAELDGGLLQMQRDVFRLSRAIRQNNDGRLGSRLVDLLEQSELVFESGWLSVNSIPATNVQCENQQFCFNVNFANNQSSFEEASEEIRSISKTFNRRLRRILVRNEASRAERRRLTRPFRRIRAQNAQNLVTAQTVLLVDSDACQ